MTGTEQESAVWQAETPRKSRRWLAAAAAVVVLTAGGVVVAQIAGTDAPTTPITPAAQLLHRAADADQAGEPGPGEYRYTRTRALRTSHFGVGSPSKMFSAAVKLDIELWIPADPTDVWMMRRKNVGEVRWLIGSEREAAAEGISADELWPEGTWTEPCGAFEYSPTGVPLGPDGMGCGEGRWELLTPEWIDALPRDPHEMLARLRKDAGAGKGQDATALATRAAPALETGQLPADVRRAMFEALALMPEIEITEDAIDFRGRTGTALGIRADNHQVEIIVDQKSGEFLGIRTVQKTKRSGVEPGTTTSYSSVSTAIVDAMGQRPSK